jgi:catechol 2,3-dioxygenase-like lactoylglutathione lyase family enzyme
MSIAAGEATAHRYSGEVVQTPEEGPMLSTSPTHTTLPVADLERAREFYEGVLGLVPESVNPGGVMYATGGGSRLLVFPSGGRASGTHTQIGFTVADIVAEVMGLKSRGVAFETYDMPGFDAVTSTATTGNIRAAWFYDRDGNLLSIVQFT